jgi:competence protein ComEC
LTALAVFSLNEVFAAPVLQFGAWFVSMNQELILWFSNLSWAFFWVGSIPVLWLLGYYAVLTLLLSSLRRRVKTASMAAVLILVCEISGAGRSSFYGSAGDALQVIAIDVGQGTSTLVRFPTGETMLVDGGGYYDDSFDVGRSILAPFLWACGVTRLDRVVLSHDHPDHANGLRFILSHFDVGSYHESGISGAPGGRSGLSGIAERRKIPIVRMKTVPFNEEIGPCGIRILHPSPEYIAGKWNGDLNNISLALSIDYGGTRVILPGDMDASVEEYLFGDYSSSQKVLFIAPHHGSDRSTGRLLLDRVQPRTLIVSCGFDNLFGFPSGRILEECRRRGIPCFRTDLCGAVFARSDGKEWSVQTMNPCPQPGGGK